MRYRTLGNTGTVVSVQCLGTMTFGDEADEETSGRIIEAFIEAGGNFLDTADVYSKGISEQVIGRWLASHATDAEQLVIATKGRFPMGPGANDYGASRRHLRDALDSSLARLGVDFVDLYQIHAFDALTPLEETLRFLNDAITAGKIGAYGFSNFTGWQLTKAAWIAKVHGWAPPVTLQPQYSLLVRGIEHEIVPAALDQAIGLLPWSPARRRMADRQVPARRRPYGRDPPRHESGARHGGVRPPQRGRAHLARARRGRSRSPMRPARRQAAVALAWLDAQPGVTSTILGARTVEQLQQNLAAVELELDDAQLATLTEASTPRAEVYPYGPQAVQQRHRALVPEA